MDWKPPSEQKQSEVIQRVDAICRAAGPSVKLFDVQFLPLDREEGLGGTSVVIQLDPARSERERRALLDTLVKDITADPGIDRVLYDPRWDGLSMIKDGRRRMTEAEVKQWLAGGEL